MLWAVRGVGRISTEVFWISIDREISQKSIWEKREAALLLQVKALVLGNLVLQTSITSSLSLNCLNFELIYEGRPRGHLSRALSIAILKSPPIRNREFGNLFSYIYIYILRPWVKIINIGHNNKSWIHISEITQRNVHMNHSQNVKYSL